MGGRETRMNLVPVHFETPAEHERAMRERIADLQRENDQLRQRLESPWMTRAEAAEVLRVSHDVIDRAIARGQLPRRRVGVTVLLPRSAVESLVTR